MIRPTTGARRASVTLCPGEAVSKHPHFYTMLSERNYSGCLGFLRFYESSGSYKNIPGNGDFIVTSELQIKLWIAYCLAHSNDYAGAVKEYEAIKKGCGIKKSEISTAARMYEILCHLAMGHSTICEKLLDGFNEHPSSLSEQQNALLTMMRAFSKESNEGISMLQNISKNNELTDLCLAGLYYNDRQFQEAASIYRSMMSKYPEYKAVAYYLALCLYQCDDFEHTLEITEELAKTFPNSVLVVSLKAACEYQLIESFTARETLNSLGAKQSDVELIYKKYPEIRHNLFIYNYVCKSTGKPGQLSSLCVGSETEVFGELVHSYNEAVENMCIYFLHKRDPIKAAQLLQSLNKKGPQAELLTICTLTMLSTDWPAGSENLTLSIPPISVADKAALASDQITVPPDEPMTRERAKLLAQIGFFVYGRPEQIRDTIPGREAIASYYFIQENWSEVLVYLRSIESYVDMEEAFLMNYGQALIQSGNYNQGYQALLGIREPSNKHSLEYKGHLALAYINQGNPEAALLLTQTFLGLDVTSITRLPNIEPMDDSVERKEEYNLLHIIAHQCYVQEHYIVSTIAYAVLEIMVPFARHIIALEGSIMNMLMEAETDEAADNYMALAKNCLLSINSQESDDFLNTILYEWWSETVL